MGISFRFCWYPSVYMILWLHNSSLGNVSKADIFCSVLSIGFYNSFLKVFQSILHYLYIKIHFNASNIPVTSKFSSISSIYLNNMCALFWYFYLESFCLLVISRSWSNRNLLFNLLTSLVPLHQEQLSKLGGIFYRPSSSQID